MGRTAIIVTFDLHDVPNEDKYRVYTRIKKDLAKLRLNKFIVKEDGNETSLPHNTFVGILEGSLFKREVATIRDRAKQKIKAIIERHHQRATIFVFVGKNWAWSRPKLR